MSKYISDKDAMRFPSQESLIPVQNILNEASAALNDKTRTISDSAISDVLSGAVGAGVGSAASFAALYFGGTVGLSAAGITSGLAAAGSIVGGGMVAGVGVLAAPIAILGMVGVGIAAHKKAQQLKEAKEICYTEAIRMQNAIIESIKEENFADKKRIEYLNSLNVLLQKAVCDLHHDLGDEES